MHRGERCFGCGPGSRRAEMFVARSAGHHRARDVGDRGENARAKMRYRRPWEVMIFAIVNESTNPDLTTVELERWAIALSQQIANDVASLWECLPCMVGVYTPNTVPENASVLHLVDLIPEAPTALAYHTRDGRGRPVLRL